MKLNLSQIKSVTCGAEWIEERDAGIVFHRFTREQERLYQTRKKESMFFEKALSPAGVKFRFRTDSSVLSLAGCVTSGCTRTYYSFDLLIDGRFQASYNNFSQCPFEIGTTAKLPLGDFSCSFDLGQGEKEVCLYFPWSQQVLLRSVFLEDGASLTPVVPKRTLLCYGDSITQGYDALFSANTYVARLARELDAEEYNKAIGGEVFYPELASKGEDFTPDLITVAYGTNDWSKRPFSEFRKDCFAFFENLVGTFPASPIFAVTPIWRKGYENGALCGDFAQVGDVMAEAAAKWDQVTYLSGFDFVPHKEELFADRRLHPNDEGFKFYAGALAERIREVLKEN